MTQAISADSHVTEPTELWAKYIEPKFRDRAPRLERRPDTDALIVEGLPPLLIAAFGANAGRSSDKIRQEGRFDVDVPRAGWDAAVRVAETPKDGVSGEVLYPSVGLRLFSLNDLDYKYALFRAYNRWLADFCATHPKQLKGVGMVALDDVERGVDELRVIGKSGLAGAMIPINPGERPYNDPAYEPFWAAAQELGLSLSLHTHSERRPRPDFSRTMLERTTNDMMVRQSIAAMVLGGVFAKYPGVKALSVENDVGWAPYFLHRMDYTFGRHMAVHGWKLDLTRPPSSYVRSNCYFTFQFDKSWVPSRHFIGIDQIMWASDYPHTDSTWPNSKKVIDGIFEGVPDAERQKVIADNARKLYRF
ncbi:MAG: amidohydrolase [Chloroflexi bacterium]|nr:amidohydrolase [Chloroflexota bacterium]